MRRRTMLIVTALAAVALAASGCGSGGSGDDDATVTPAATQVPFNPALLTGVVLNPDDFPPGTPTSGFPAPEATSFTSVHLHNELRYQSTVVYFDTAQLANEEFQRNRKVLPALAAGTREENYEMTGTESSFLYTVQTPPGLALWAVRDKFMVFLQIAPTNYETPSPAAIDRTEFARIADIVGRRLDTLVLTPDLVTPVVGPSQPAQTPAPTP